MNQMKNFKIVVQYLLNYEMGLFESGTKVACLVLF